jgi:hypothetical protein
VIGAEITRICGRLIDIGLARGGFAFEFDDNDAAADEKQRIDTPRFKGNVVFKNDERLSLQVRVLPDKRVDTSLEQSNRITPRPNLRLPSIGDELLKAFENVWRARFEKFLKGTAVPEQHVWPLISLSY